VLHWTWLFASAKPPYAYAIISVDFSIDVGMFYANTRRNFVAGSCHFFTVNLLKRR